MPWKTEMESIREKLKWRYKSPLPKGKPRVTARGRSGKVKVYSDEEIHLYKLRMFGEEVSTE